MKNITICILILLALAKSVHLANATEKRNADEELISTKNFLRLPLPYLEQEESGKLNENGTYDVSGSFYYEKNDKEYKVSYVVHKTGYDLKKYVIKDKSQDTVRPVGFGNVVPSTTQYPDLSSGPNYSQTGLGSFGTPNAGLPAVALSTIPPWDIEAQTGLGSYGKPDTGLPASQQPSGTGLDNYGTLNAGFPTSQQTPDRRPGEIETPTGGYSGSLSGQSNTFGFGNSVAPLSGFPNFGGQTHSQSGDSTGFENFGTSNAGFSASQETPDRRPGQFGTPTTGYSGSLSGQSNTFGYGNSVAPLSGFPGSGGQTYSQPGDSYRFGTYGQPSNYGTGCYGPSANSYDAARCQTGYTSLGAYPPILPLLVYVIPPNLLARQQGGALYSGLSLGLPGLPGLGPQFVPRPSPPSVSSGAAYSSGGYSGGYSPPAPSPIEIVNAFLGG